jgi:hypothetical protein
VASEKGAWYQEGASNVGTCRGKLGRKTADTTPVKEYLHPKKVAVKVGWPASVILDIGGT